MDYTIYIMKFGEHGVQAIIEDIEKREHIRYDNVISLEERWARVMTNSKVSAAA